jgi:hypothetical protein
MLALGIGHLQSRTLRSEVSACRAMVSSLRKRAGRGGLSGVELQGFRFEGK